LSDYVDGRTPLADSHEVRGHLELCPRCCREWEELLALKRVLAAARAPSAPAGFWDRAAVQVRERADTRHPTPYTLRPTPYAGRRWWDRAWQRAPALVASTAAVLTLVLVPLSIDLDRQDAPALDMPAAMAHHAAYSEQFPLTDRRSMDYVVDESRRQAAD
jgi:anti-sigma factor RsiW